MKHLPEQEVIECYNAHTIKFVAKKFNVSQEVIAKILTKNEIVFHSRKESIKLHNIETYGTETIPENVRVDLAKRRADTKQARYGDPNYNNREKFVKTCTEKYDGVGLQSSTIQEKVKKTCIEKYGVDNPAKALSVQQKMQATAVERYGVASVFQSPKIQTKIQETCLKKYNVASPGSIPSRVEHARDTAISNWGHSNYCNREQAKKTLKQLYGVESPMQSDIIKERATIKSQERYGVPWNCMRSEARLAGNNSTPNREFAALLDVYSISYEREFVLNQYSFDFKVQNTLIEINPTATHNSTWTPFGDHSGVDRLYHQSKMRVATDNGYKCVMLWDWDNIEQFIKSLLPRPIYYGRKCTIKTIDKQTAATFINQHHLQGYANDSIRLGLYHNNELVSVMTFGKPRYNKNYEYELIRYCSNSNVVGGAQRLFRHFLKNYVPTSIISYCDLSKFSGTLYTDLGFTKFNDPSPSKHWYNIKTKKHITDNLLRQRGIDQLLGTTYGKGTSNDDLMKHEGFVEIFDCGQARYSWKLD